MASESMQATMAHHAVRGDARARAFALALPAFAFYRVFVGEASSDAAAIYLWKPLDPLALIAAAGFAGYLTYVRAQRDARDG